MNAVVDIERLLKIWKEENENDFMMPKFELVEWDASNPYLDLSPAR